jgi:hypothetical protein
MPNADDPLKAGDSVRVISGPHKGKTGKALGVFPLGLDGEAQETVPVAFTAGGRLR